MATRQLSTFLHRLRRAVAGRDGAGLSDTQLLERFVRGRDEAAFEVLVWRHGPMVLAVCRRLLRRAQDAEDAFQATFLVLLRKAAAIGKREAVAAWLYKVAYRAALRVRAETARQAELNSVEVNLLPARPGPGPGWDEVRPVIDEEVRALPGAYRLTFILCYLEGKTQAEAAHQLGCPPGTVASRLAWARQRLRTRLARRGVVLSGAALAALLDRQTAPAAPPAPLVPSTVRAALRFAAGQSAAAGPAAVAEGVLHAMRMSRLKAIAALLLIACVLGTGSGLAARRALAGEDTRPAPELVPSRGAGLRLPPEMPAKLGLQTGEVKARTAPPRVIEMIGALAVDPDRVVRVQSRFAGEALEIGPATPGAKGPSLSVGDRVKKGQLMAVVWSKDLALKKAELLDALMQLQRDQERLGWLERMYKKGYVTEAAVRQGRRDVTGDTTAVARVERTLHAWRVAEDDVKAIKDAAEGKRDPAREKDWARVELRAPIDGTVLERNATVGTVVDPTFVLFKVADLSRLAVHVDVPAADATELSALKPEQRRWTISPLSDSSFAPIAGAFDRIGAVVDRDRGTVMVTGRIVNPGGRLRPGQAVRVRITIPRAVSEVSVPASALVEEGGATYVFVQPDARERVYVPLRVEVVRRDKDTAHVRSAVTVGQMLSAVVDYDGNGSAELLALALQQVVAAEARPRSLRPGDRIVTAGAVELKALLHDLKPGRPR
jgi:cobalt-zinc-cadmium efflux system membrane fusion protein